MSFWADLKKRKLGQWSLTYLAGAWLVWQVLDVMGDRWGLTQGLGRALDLVLIAGFFLTLVLAWHHGEKGRQKVTATEALMIVGILAVCGAVLPTVWTEPNGGTDAALVAAGEAAVPNASIAVLPFLNLSSDPEQEYFSDGLAEEILNTLAQITDLHVTSRSSAFSFKDEAVDIPEVAARLGVAHVLEGSVQKVGNQVRITAQLIEAETDRHLWSERFDRELEVSEVFAVQDEIAAAIVEALVAAMGVDTAPVVRESQVVSAEAYDLYLRGLQARARGTVAGHRAARTYFEQAIAREPTYAVAHATLSRTLLDLASAGEAPNDLVRRVANEAIRLEPDLGLPYTVMGLIEEREGGGRSDLTFELREQAYERAPGDAWVVLQYGRALEAQGRVGEAEPLMRKAVELDPLDVEQRTGYGRFLYLRGRPMEGLRQVERATEIAPDNPRGWLYRGDVSGGVGDFVSSIEAFARYHALEPANAVGAFRVAMAYLDLGDLAAARRWMEEAMRRGAGPDVGFEVRYLLLNGQREEARDMARREFEARGAPFRAGGLMRLVVADMVERGALREAEDFLFRYEDRLADFVTGPIPDPVAFPAPAVSQAFAIALHDVYRRAGRTVEAQALAERLNYRSMQGYLSTIQLGWGASDYYTEALWHLRAGRHSDALAALEESVGLGLRQDWRLLVRDNFLLDDVREDPRFSAIVETLESDMSRQRTALAERMPALEEELAVIGGGA